MSGVNKILIIGTLGRDPETVFTNTGVAITTISVATSETWKDKNTGEKKEKTEWHRIKFFSPKAEIVGKHFIKGMWIYVEGRNETSSYEKDGITRYSTDIIANNFQFIGKADNQGSQQGQQQNQQQNFQQPQQHTGSQQGFHQNNNSGFQNQGNQGFNTPPEDD